MPIWVHGTDKNVHVDFNKCKEDATAAGYKYFALQAGKMVNGEFKGVCFASNDLSSSQRYGKSGNCMAVPGTNNHTGKEWTNFIYGTADVEPPEKPSTIPTTVTPVGCYKDESDRAMPDWVLGNTYSTIDECRSAAAYKGLQYFGLQNVTNGKGICFGTNDEPRAKKYGVSTN
jgi:hypothetical protein